MNFQIEFEYHDQENNWPELSSLEKDQGMQQINMISKVFKEFLTQEFPSIASNDILIMLELSMIDDEQMIELNSEHRGKEKTTDVLSFPVHEDLRKELERGTLEDLGHLHLGDIIISGDQTLRQAQEHNIDPYSEFYHLLTHGFLHLLGFDHELSPEEEELMLAKEKVIIDLISKSLSKV